jgi:hypothetical protein
MVDDGPASMDLDREKVGLLLLQLGDPQRSLNKSENQARAPQTGRKLSKYAVHFVEHIGSSSYSYLFEVGLLCNIHSLTLTPHSMHFCSKRIQTVGRGI